jgi:hypothetical protein
VKKALAVRDTIKVHHFAIIQTLKFIIFLSLLIEIPLIIGVKDKKHIIQKIGAKEN